MTRENVRDKRIPPAMLEREIKELARKIAKLRIADLKSSRCRFLKYLESMIIIRYPIH